MKTRVLIVALTSVLFAIGATGCGGDGGDEVDSGKVSSELQKAGMSEEQADCIADALDKADLTYDDYKDGSFTDLSDPKIKQYVSDAAECMGAGSGITVPDKADDPSDDPTDTTEADDTTETTADGGGSGLPSDPEELSAQLQAGGLPAAQADCLANALSEAGLTAEDYENFGDSDGPNITDPEMQQYITDAAQCMTMGG